MLPLVVAVIVAGGLVQYLRPLPSARLVAVGPSQVRLPGTLGALPWPTSGEAAVALDGVGMIGSHGGARSEPIGSLAKIMTALLVLRTHPLGAGASGPTVTVTPADVATYQQDLATGQSVVKVAAGEQLTELQLLEAMLIPSGNNVATLLAQWDAGSVGAFVNRMNRTARGLGLHHTRYADASGLSAHTVSDARDETVLAEQAMANPVFSQIVAMPQVTLPVAGVAYNVDAEVTHGGIVGVKTGSTPEAGGCFVFAWRASVSGRSELILGAVLGQGGVSIIDSALSAGVALARAVVPDLKLYTPVASTTVVARLSAPWAPAQRVTAGRSVSLVGWPGLRVGLRVLPSPLATSVPAGARVGSLQVSTPLGRVDLPLPAPARIGRPPLSWRLTRV